MPRILLTHTPQMRHDYYGEKALAELKALGEVRFHEGAEPLSPQALIEAARGCDIVVSDRMTPGPAAVFAGATDIAAFLRCAVDIRNIDVAAASANGILVTRASPGFVAAVAELVVGFMVDLARHVPYYAGEYRAGRMPEVQMGRQLAGSTLGIIGYGSIGRYLAPLGLALGMRVLVSDPYAKVEHARLEQVELTALLAEADFAVCLAVATEETENLIDAAALATMKPSAYFINVSRGNLVDEAALERTLRDGGIAGAAMDVGRAPDQMPTPRLAALPNVVATPHIGGLTPQAIEHQALETARQAREIIAGRIPEGAVNAEQASRLARFRH